MVNAEVPIDDDFDYFTDGYPYSRINIWARIKGSPLSDEAPVLLFIQCSNDSKVKNHSLCLPVSESSKDAGMLVSFFKWYIVLHIHDYHFAMTCSTCIVHPPVETQNTAEDFFSAAEQNVKTPPKKPVVKEIYTN